MYSIGDISVNLGLGEAGEVFTKVSKQVLAEGVSSALSMHDAEIIHHLERRLTNPNKILDAENLVPLTGYEHDMVHKGVITLQKTGGYISAIDGNGAKWRLDLKKFVLIWNSALTAELKKSPP